MKFAQSKSNIYSMQNTTFVDGRSELRCYWELKSIANVVSLAPLIISSTVLHGARSMRQHRLHQRHVMDVEAVELPAVASVHLDLRLMG